MAIIKSGTSADLAKVNASGQLMVTGSSRTLTGIYLANSGLLSIQAAAHAATAGFLWLINPVGSSKILAVRRVETDTIGVAASAAITRLQIERVTFSGTASGAQITPSKLDSTYPTATGLLLTASTGLTLAAGAVTYSWFCMAVITAASVAEPVMGEWEPNEEGGRPILRAGEGLVLRQADAGIASDPRRTTVNLAWEEWAA